MTIHRKSLLDGCDNWEFSIDLLEWNKHPKVTQDTGMRPDILFHSSATQQIIMIELTVPYESGMEEASIYIKEEITGLEQRAGKSWIQIPDIVYRLLAL
ncbi:polyprotein [Plakobranchus ocellatus]|uniref:Polyprotein n=1 Tax=Plakobranchus ocellatus TaxID=259542 RepID=A0AAV4ARJ0_9GAST|nr:polyprotein [Plakobranchus ocellatus]